MRHVLHDSYLVFNEGPEEQVKADSGRCEDDKNVI